MGDGGWTVRNGPDVLEDALARLLRAEEVNNLMIGLLRQGLDGVHLAAAVRDGRIGAVGMRNAIKYLLSDADEPEAVDALAANALALQRDLPGWQGPTAEAARFGEAWRAGGGTPAVMGMRLRVHRLRAVRHPAGVPGHLETATAADRELLVRWVVDFVAEALAQGAPDAEATVDRHLGAGTLAVWRDGDRTVSMAAGRGFTPSGARISLVFTPPELRRRGYAGACVAALSARLLAEGRRFCFLYTDLANPTSNALYRRIGYEPVCDADEYWVQR